MPKIRLARSWSADIASAVDAEAAARTAGDVASSRQYPLATGQDTFDRSAGLGDAAAMNSGEVLFVYFKAYKAEAEARLIINCGTTAAAATPTLCKMALFSKAGNGDLAQMAVTANDTSLFATANTEYGASRAFASPSSALVIGNWYAAAVLVISAGAMPSFIGVNQGVATAYNNIMALEPRFCTMLPGQSDMPSSVSNASLNTTRRNFYGRLLPS